MEDWVGLGRFAAIIVLFLGSRRRLEVMACVLKDQNDRIMSDLDTRLYMEGLRLPMKENDDKFFEK